MGDSDSQSFCGVVIVKVCRIRVILNKYISGPSAVLWAPLLADTMVIDGVVERSRVMVQTETLSTSRRASRVSQSECSWRPQCFPQRRSRKIRPRG